MKILTLSATFPYPPTRGGTQVRTFHLLKHLARNHEVTVLTLPTPDVTDEEIEALEKTVGEVRVFPRGSGEKYRVTDKMGRFLRFLADGTPPNVRSLYRRDIQRWLDGAIGTGRFDAITCEHSVNEIFVRPHWRRSLRTVVNIHSSVYKTCKEELETGLSERSARDRLYLPLLKRYERRFCEKFNVLVVTTPEDRQSIETVAPGRPVRVIPNGVDLELFPYRSADPGGYRLTISGGMDHGANIDAAVFFAREIFPLLRDRYPELTLTIVGANPAPPVLELARNPGIAVTGRVPSMVEYLHSATVCVVPTRSGFGIKNKTLEAMAAGAPVVASDRGLEGLSVDGDNVPLRALRANRVEEYVRAISHLLESAGARATLSRNGRALIEGYYTWERAGTEYERVLVAAS